MAQQLHPEIRSSAGRSSREHQPPARLRNKLLFLFSLVGGAHATDMTSPHTSPLSQGWHLPWSSAREKAGFNRAGDLGRIPLFHCCPLFHEKFNENEFSPRLLKLQVRLFLAHKYSLYIQSSLTCVGSGNSLTNFIVPAFQISQFQPKWFMKTSFGLSHLWKVLHEYF